MRSGVKVCESPRPTIRTRFAVKLPVGWSKSVSPSSPPNNEGLRILSSRPFSFSLVSISDPCNVFELSERNRQMICRSASVSAGLCTRIRMGIGPSLIAISTGFGALAGAAACTNAGTVELWKECDPRTNNNNGTTENLFIRLSPSVIFGWKNLLGVRQVLAGLNRARRGRMRPVVALADKAHGCGTRNVELLRLNPNPELFAKHHPQEAEQSDDRRCRTLHSDNSVEHPYTQTNYKGYEQDFHRIPPA